VTGWEDTAKAVSDGMQAIYLNKAQPADALNAAAAQANKSLGH
jgi:multiple sugar transport system substrate-binding protein